MDSYDLMSSDHFHVVLHPNREHGILFNRLDGTVTIINYEDAKELTNLKLVATTYGIVGRFLDKYLVLIKSCSKVGSLHEPDSRTDHDVYVINQIEVIEVTNVVRTYDTPTRSDGSSRDKALQNDTYDKNNVEEHELDERKVNDDFSSLPSNITTNSYNSAQSRAAQWNPFKLSNPFKPIIPKTLARASKDSHPQSMGADSSVGHSTESSQIKTSTSDNNQHSQILDEAERRLAHEMMKLFENTNSFYFSPTLDLTHRFSKKCEKIRTSGTDPIWRTADERFFWNKHMLKDLIELSRENSDANRFICIVLQGFISIERHASHNATQQHYDKHSNANSTNESDFSSIEVARLAIESTNWTPNVAESSTNNRDCDTEAAMDNPNNAKSASESGKATRQALGKSFELVLVSRRSVFQAGTRYRRRGCDEMGNCANFVETEQIFRSNQHFTSITLIRGSIPLFWYQTGYNYRPPPVLRKSEEENHEAFKKHFENLFYYYQTEQIIVIDCTEHSGREKILHDAYRQHLVKLSNTYKQLKLIEFDFHRHCRGRQLNDTQIEANLRACGLDEKLLKGVKYYWNDGDVVWNQEGVFRVNCLDCSDRTNVVQRNVALQILDLQLARLGIIAPDQCPDDNICRRLMQSMWSANGNALSTQYCGTRALFGGDTRKLTGYIKDTYSSASRYYISKFRDVYRQAAIDAMLGIESSETENLKSGTVGDQYELLSFDPILAGRQGGALIRDMGSRVGHRLARLRGKLAHATPFSHIDTSSLSSETLSRLRLRQGGDSSSSVQISDVLSGSSGNRRVYDDNTIIETGLVESLCEMNIDWPVSESMENLSTMANDTPTKPPGEKLGKGENEEEKQKKDVFSRFSNCNQDCYQDDDFGQLMDDY